MEPTTLLEAVRHYSDIAVCENLLAEIRWPEGPCCERCGSLHVKKLATRRVWKCYDCKRQFSVKVGTIMEDSAIGLDKWFVCMWMIANCKNGISSYEVHRALGVKQETAWFMLHRVRHAMQTGSFKKVSGTIEVDETFIGGKEKNKHVSKSKYKKAGTQGKVAVMGVLQRKGRVSAKVISDLKRKSLHPEVVNAVEAGSTVYTDALKSYARLNETFEHDTVDHAREYVRGEVHTNGIENYWSLLKRSLKGTYVSVEPFYLNRYLDEQSFRFNNRKTDDGTRFILALSQVTGRRLTYDQLLAEG